jgi:hypothetical protein
MTKEQLEAIAAAKAEAERLQAEQDAFDAEMAIIEAYKKKLGENDDTDIDVVPIILNDDPFLEIQGMFFNEQGGFTEEMEPVEELTIEKDVLDRSSGFIVVRFGYVIQNRGKIVFEVSLDGKKIDGFGTNLPYLSSGGLYDTTLFEYPGTAKANKDGKHKVHVKAGIITGIVEGNTNGKNEGLGLKTWGEVKGITEADFVINLLPHKEE